MGRLEINKHLSRVYEISEKEAHGFPRAALVGRHISVEYGSSGHRSKERRNVSMQNSIISAIGKAILFTSAACAVAAVIYASNCTPEVKRIFNEPNSLTLDTKNQSRFCKVFNITNSLPNMSLLNLFLPKIPSVNLSSANWSVPSGQN